MMIDKILDIVATVDGVLWGPWTMIFIASVAVYLSVKSGFFQVRKFPLIWRNTFGKIFQRPESESTKKMTPFQATTTALASTVGTGNMAGVATALSIDSFSSALPQNISSALISLAILTFCLSTLIGFYIYFETSAINVFGRRSIKYLKWLYLMPGVIFAGVANVDRLWVFANIAVGVCAIPNLIAVLALSSAFFILMRDYMQGQNKYLTDITDKEKNYVKKNG